MSGSHSWYIFHKSVKSCNSTTWFRIGQFQTITWTVERAIFSIFLRNVNSFGLYDPDILKRKLVSSFKWHESRLLVHPTFFPSSMVYFYLRTNRVAVSITGLSISNFFEWAFRSALTGPSCLDGRTTPAPGTRCSRCWPTDWRHRSSPASYE